MFILILFIQLSRTYVLKRGAVGASGTASTGNETVLLPLWGQICCNLMAQPACANEIRRAGFINMQVSLISTTCVCIVYCGNEKHTSLTPLR